MQASNKTLAVAGFAVVVFAAVPALAHHSFAMFDNQKTVVLVGTVKEFQWTNPHTWVQLLVRNSSGQEVEWSIEGGSPSGLSSRGWARNSLKPGDKATVAIHPLKDGSTGGSLVRASNDGHEIGNVHTPGGLGNPTY